MKIRLTTSPHVRHPAILQSDFQIDPSVMIPFIPTGLLSLVSSTRAALGLVPTIYDLNRRIIDGTVALGSGFYRDAAEKLCSDQPDLIGFMTETESYHHVLQICSEIKTLHPACKIVLGGPHASAVARATCETWPSIDYIVRSEGEVSFTELVRHIMSGTEGPLPGVVQRCKDGTVIDGGERPLVDDLDSLPYPAYEQYQPDPGEEIFFEVGRGCPFKCTFCSTAPFWKRKHRVKSAQRIVEELRHVVDLYGCQRVHFTHDLFTTDKAWVHEVCHALREAGTPVQWTCSSRVDTIDERLLASMASAGCCAIYFGIESGSARVLRDIRKHIPDTQSFAVLEQCTKAGITPNAGFIGGFPSDDAQSIAETFDAYTRALKLGCNPVHLFLFTPFSGSTIIPNLSSRICTGHFVDLPLGRELDEANRQLIASDPVLFGAYHRPRRQGDGLSEEIFDGLEEFPTLISSALVPALHVARSVGGMFGLYKRWLRWIEELNATRGAAWYRRFYASPLHFCDFLVDLLESLDEDAPHLQSLLQVIRTNHLVAQTHRARLPTTMANYRSKIGPDTISIIDLSAPLQLGDIVAHLELAHDVAPLLAAKPGDDVPQAMPGPMYLVWQQMAPDHVRLLRVGAFMFHAVQHLQGLPKDAGQLVSSWMCGAHRDGRDADFIALVEDLTKAIRAGIIQQTKDR